MATLFNKYLKEKSNVRKELTKIYGINNFLSNQICDYLGFSKLLKIKDLTQTEKNLITKLVLNNYSITEKLKQDVKNSITHLVSISSYRGIRHIKKLPLRGQRTHTNAKSCKKIKRI